MNNQLFIVGGLFKVEKFEVVIKLSECHYEEKFKEFCNHFLSCLFNIKESSIFLHGNFRAFIITSLLINIFKFPVIIFRWSRRSNQDQAAGNLLTHPSTVYTRFDIKRNP